MGREMVGLDTDTITVTGIAPKVSGMASVQRHPTMPMTKRDSLVMTGSRLSLISISSNTAAAAKHEDKETVNTHPDMVAGKRRSPRKAKRTDSYKRALNRLSTNDNLEEVPLISNTDSGKRRDDRQKYNTLPINTATTTCNGEMRQRKKRPSGCNEGGEILRNVSQKSGTYPSPDTDEDQRSIQPERKKKSAFKRFKERFISSVRRDSRSSKKSKKGPERGSQSSSKRAGRVRPNHNQSAMGFHTPNENSANHQTLQNGHNLDKVDGRSQTLYPGEMHGHAEDSSSSRKSGGSGLLDVLRRSFRRKQSPELRSSKRNSSSDRPSSNEIHPSPKVHHQPSRESDRIQPSHTSNTSTAIDIPRRREDIALDDIFDADADDTITAIFGSIIDNDKSSFAGTLHSPPRARADRSKLRLDGLRKYRPKSFDKTEPHGQKFYGFQAKDLSPTVDIDGLDYADGLPDQVQRPGQVKEEEGDLLFYEVSQEEKQRRIDDVARCLAALGDRIAAAKALGAGDSASELEGHRIGQLSSLERSLVRDLRHYADKEFSFGQGVSVATNLMPAVKNIIAAQDYSNFKQVVQQELSNTNGWDQVAWYTYLIKTAVCIADSSVGSEVKKRAKKYFNSFIRPWIQSRPNGWESIHEETDIEDS